MTQPAFGDPRLPARFWAKVEAQADGCWQWTGCIPDHGYASFRSPPGCSKRAHRYAYCELVGDPGDLSLDHLCRNTACVNPAHLEPVTHAENVLRGVGPCAVNAAKTHCVRGHELTGDNVVGRPGRSSGRWCRACENARKDTKTKISAEVPLDIAAALNRLAHEAGHTRADEVRLAIDRHLQSPQVSRDRSIS